MKARGKNQKPIRRCDDMSKVQKDMIAGFEDEKGLQTKDCGQPLKV